MSDNHTLMHQQALAKPPPATDGWDDAAAEAAERTIRGQLLKFADWRWTVGKEATPIQDGTKLVALATSAMWVRWEDGKPAGVPHARARQAAARPRGAWLRRREQVGEPQRRAARSVAKHPAGLSRGPADRRGLHLQHIVVGRSRGRDRSR